MFRYSLFFLMLCGLGTLAQNVPQLTSFTALIADNQGLPLTNTPTNLRLSLREGSETGPVVYCAVHEDTTNANGYVSINLNRDVLSTGCNGASLNDFEDIPWENGNMWLEMEYRDDPLNPFVGLGVLELAASYYAFVAGTAEKVDGLDFDLSGVQQGDNLQYDTATAQWLPIPPFVPLSDFSELYNEPTLLSQFNNDVGFIASANDADASITNELQTWSNLPGRPAGFADGTDAVNDADASSTNELQIWGNLPSIPAGFADNNDDMNDGDYSASNEFQLFSVSVIGDTLFLSDANWVLIHHLSMVNYPEHHICGASNIHNSDLTYSVVSDQEGNEYRTVVIGGQEWMAENLTTSTYSNGDPIPNITDQTEWEGLQNTQEGAWVYYGNDSQYECPYGKLYNWYAVADARNVCPAGWHVPTDTEWTVLTDYLGGEPGKKMKSTGTQYWQTGSNYATNESGFSCLPGGLRAENPIGFAGVESSAALWSSTENVNSQCWFRSLTWNVGIARSATVKTRGYSVRCLKD